MNKRNGQGSVSRQQGGISVRGGSEVAPLDAEGEGHGGAGEGEEGEEARDVPGASAPRAPAAEHL